MEPVPNGCDCTARELLLQLLLVLFAVLTRLTFTVWSNMKAPSEVVLLRFTSNLNIPRQGGVMLDLHPFGTKVSGNETAWLQAEVTFACPMMPATSVQVAGRVSGPTTGHAVIA